MFRIFRKREPIDHCLPKPPYYLVAKNLFAQKNGKEIHIKKIFSAETPKCGTVIMSTGTAMNSIAFRTRVDNGKTLSLDHNQSFANLLASLGFVVYLNTPSYAERVFNRYITRHCPESIYYQKHYEAPSTLTFDQMVNQEVPMVIDFVSRDAQTEALSWVGFSLGGMLAYAYLSKCKDSRIRNVVTIGSPVSLTQALVRLIGMLNRFSKALGFEEKTISGSISENFVPLTRLIGLLPGWALRVNVLAPILYNPLNISSKVLKTFFGKIVEPIPAGLENNFAHIIENGFVSQAGDFDYYQQMAEIRGRGVNFLFFYGQRDILSPPDSVKLAHQLISPKDSKNLVSIRNAGHIDLLLGHNSEEEVWKLTVRWLKEVGGGT